MEMIVVLGQQILLDKKWNTFTANERQTKVLFIF